MSEGEQLYRLEMVRAVRSGMAEIKELDLGEQRTGAPSHYVREGRGIKDVRVEGGTGRGHRRTREYVAVELWDGTIYDIRVTKRRAT